MYLSVAFIGLFVALQLTTWFKSNNDKIIELDFLKNGLIILAGFAIVATIISGVLAYQNGHYYSQSKMTIADHNSWASITLIVFLLAVALLFNQSSSLNKLAGPLLVICICLIIVTAFSYNEKEPIKKNINEAEKSNLTHWTWPPQK